MNKYRITIQPIDGPEVSYRVGGFDRWDARNQGIERWLSEDDSRNAARAEACESIAEVFVEPLTEESEPQAEARLLGRTA